MSKKTPILGAIALIAAPSLAQAQTASLHGFADVSLKNTYITPGGVVASTAGNTIQALNGLVVDLPQDPKAALTDLSFTAGTWSDFNPGYDRAFNKESFVEFHWFVGANAVIDQHWKVGAQYVEFISPSKAFKTEKNMLFTLAFDDSAYFKTFSIQPHVNLFYATAGDSTVVTGKPGGTFSLDIGATPTRDLRSYGWPLILSAPTYATVGSSEFWGGTSSFGLFSTGLKATYPLESLPAAMEHWALYGSGQYFNLTNDHLVTAEKIVTGKSDRDIGILSLGITLDF